MGIISTTLYYQTISKIDCARARYIISSVFLSNIWQRVFKYLFIFIFILDWRS